MLTRLRASDVETLGQHSDPMGRFALGHASLGILKSAPQPAALPASRMLAVADGEIYDMESVCSKLRLRGYAVECDDYAAAILATYMDGGMDAVNSLEGSFAAALVDAVGQTVTLISDRFGTRPLYYAHTTMRFSFASRISSLLADTEVPRELNWIGASQFFTFGHYLNDDTSLAAVKILPAGAVLTFDLRPNRVTIQGYWQGADRVGNPLTHRHDAFEAIDEAFFKAVQRCQAGPAHLGLSLSGGLDARTILGVFENPRDKLKTVCLGMRGSRDHDTSSELARIVGCRHHNYILETTFLANFRHHLDDMVRLTDGQYLSQCIVMPTLPLYRELGVEALLRGHAGELMHMSKAYNYSLDNQALGLSSNQALEDWLWKHLQAHMLDGLERPLFAPQELQGPQAARESLRRALSATPQSDGPAQRIAHLFLDQRLRRETMLSLMKFRSVVEPRLPYLDRVLVERLLATPMEWRIDDQLQTFILRKRQPRFCDVENTNTGTVLGASRIRRTYSELKMKVLGKFGVPGYQPYERLGLWLRRDLAELVEGILLSDACLDRGMFAADTVRHVVQRHLNGQRNHTYLIMALMIFEVGHRWLLEQDRTFDIADPTCEFAVPYKRDFA
jgi:asparagine synthase (glutamine-hydrolysing)